MGIRMYSGDDRVVVRNASLISPVKTVMFGFDASALSMHLTVCMSIVSLALAPV